MGKENNLDELLEDSPAEPDESTEPVVKILVLVIHEVCAICVPVSEEGSHDREGDHIFEDDSHEVGVKERDHEPRDGGGDIEEPAGLESLRV